MKADLVTKFPNLFGPLDIVALGVFAMAWVGYTWFANFQGRRKASLLAAMNHFRWQWITQTVQRDNRMVDASILASLLHGSTFFASTTLLILGGLMALLGTIEKATNVVAELPFAVVTSERLWEFKILLLIGIFVYAFFKFTWSVRQFNFVGVLIGSLPVKSEPSAGLARDINRVSTIASIASQNNNEGLRAYYFGVASLAWFVHPALFIVLTLWVVAVLYKREFHSQTLNVLANPWPPVKNPLKN